MEAPLNLTFGVELEIIVEYQDSPELSNELLDDSATVVFQKKIRNILHEAGFEIDMHGTGWDEGCPSSPYQKYQKWCITTDGSVRGHNSGQVGFELISPALPLDSVSLEQVRQVMMLLNKNFKIVINSTCGHHVHIGNQCDGFPEQTLRNLLSFLAVCEPHMEAFHPRQRVSNHFCLSLRNSQGILTDASHRAARLWVLDKWRILEMIQDPGRRDRSVDETLLGCTLLGKYNAYNFNNIKSGADKSKNTVEFRQHRGTFCHEEVTNWVSVIGSIFSFCHDLSTADMHLFCLEMSQVSISECNTVDLLRKIGTPELVCQYYADNRLFTVTEQTEKEPNWETLEKKLLDTTSNATSNDW